MKTYFWNEFKFYRKKKGGNWVKTKERGWMTLSNYRLYLGYRYDPIFIKEEKWQCFYYLYTVLATVKKGVFLQKTNIDYE